MPTLAAGIPSAQARRAFPSRSPYLPVATAKPAARVGTHCLRDREFVRETRSRVREERARLVERLPDALDVFPSAAPFLCCDLGASDVGVDHLLAAARERGLALRDARTFRGLDSHIRVAVRTPEENDRLLAVLEEALADG